MFGYSLSRPPTNYQMNECEYTRSNQLNILCGQSGVSSVGVWYNLPNKGTPKGLQSRINIGFIETSKLTFLNVNELVQEKWGRYNTQTVKICFKIFVVGCRFQGAEHIDSSY